jgi:hypothetical protein
MLLTFIWFMSNQRWAFSPQHLCSLACVDTESSKIRLSFLIKLMTCSTKKHLTSNIGPSKRLVSDNLVRAKIDVPVQLRRLRCSAGILVPLVVLSIFRLHFYFPRHFIHSSYFHSSSCPLESHTKKVTGICSISILQICAQNVECLVDIQINFDCSCSTRPSLPCERATVIRSIWIRLTGT